jgi:hypothetical protein
LQFRRDKSRVQPPYLLYLYPPIERWTPPRQVDGLKWDFQGDLARFRCGCCCISYRDNSRREILRFAVAVAVEQVVVVVVVSSLASQIITISRGYHFWLAYLLHPRRHHHKSHVKNTLNPTGVIAPPAGCDGAQHTCDLLLLNNGRVTVLPARKSALGSIPFT